MTLATPIDPSSANSWREQTDAIEHELEALQGAMAATRDSLGWLDQIEPEFENFLAALTRSRELTFVGTSVPVDGRFRPNSWREALGETA